ncbi:ADP-ribosylglycohydrolase family protein [Solicola gregarius]|uniref:ADP-ribosylglycohydrolase family protein n=1 Tax=Solicola gregarius TaxID=2908642 RepID=A0AA46TIH5_9ACTN|nr:ADP-ribosylglycohydrolase family protein [Solicola gregarius]UYM05479.1 ADP-ribosylglycohydrolase family protein [Solicola gregarius]
MVSRPADRQMLEAYGSRVRGSLLGGAIGDALGGPVEFWDLDRIHRGCGREGVREYVPEDVGGTIAYGRITDDTQMTLFTVEGMIRASVRTDRGLGFTVAVLHHAYDRWLDTQLLPRPDGERDSWLITERWLYSRRAPGNTCLDALKVARDGERRIRPFGGAARNQSKGCGGVMRSAPFGLLPPWTWASLQSQFDAAAEAAGYTHGHRTGQLASGALAVLIGAIMRGQDLAEAVDTMLEQLRQYEHHEGTTHAIEQAVDAAREPASAAAIEELGDGWVAEEALGIAVYAALAYPEPSEICDALALAVTHSGDSDSTGAICGNILGALHGETALPPVLAFEVEGRGTILTLADDFIYEFTAGDRLHGDYGPDTRWGIRYPGW